MKIKRTLLVAALASTTAACGADDSAGAGSAAAGQASLTERLGSLNRDLGPGMKGDDVRAVHEALSRVGYFPNARLQQDYPAWRPLVAQGPADQAVYDDRTAQAVTAFQANMQLAQTGIVDAATRAVLQAPRCGVPEGLPRIDVRDKYAQGGSTWNRTTIYWRVWDLDPGITLNGVTITDTRNAVRAALATWAAQTNLTFVEVTRTPADIEIRYGKMDGRDGLAARCDLPAQGGDMTIDYEEIWSVASPTPANAIDLQSAVLHELGHGLGLGHSGFERAVMYPSYFFGLQRRALDLDDKAGISTLYDVWEQMPGLARDIGVGADGSVWAIGTTPMGNGDYSIQKFNGSSWVATDGGAVRIGVGPNGTPWVVNAVGSIYRRTVNSPTSGQWVQIDGTAKDIAGGADGSVWKIGTTPMGTAGDFSIEKYTAGTWTATDGGAVRIGVGPDGTPWVVNSVGNIYRRTSREPTSGWWEQLPGQATDIGINDGNIAWSIGTTLVTRGGDYNIQVWDEQPATGGGAPPAPQLAQWIQIPGGARAISVDRNGRPWVVNFAGNIYRSQR